MRVGGIVVAAFDHHCDAFFRFQEVVHVIHNQTMVDLELMDSAPDDDWY
jgi:hypothetical protein